MSFAGISKILNGLLQQAGIGARAGQEDVSPDYQSIKMDHNSNALPILQYLQDLDRKRA